MSKVVEVPVRERESSWLKQPSGRQWLWLHDVSCQVWETRVLGAMSLYGRLYGRRCGPFTGRVCAEVTSQRVLFQSTRW